VRFQDLIPPAVTLDGPLSLDDYAQSYDIIVTSSRCDFAFAGAVDALVGWGLQEDNAEFRAAVQEIIFKMLLKWTDTEDKISEVYHTYLDYEHTPSSEIMSLAFAQHLHSKDRTLALCALKIYTRLPDASEEEWEWRWQKVFEVLALPHMTSPHLNIFKSIYEKRLDP
jgi:hypothetical protein